MSSRPVKCPKCKVVIIGQDRQTAHKKIRVEPGIAYGESMTDPDTVWAYCPNCNEPVELPDRGRLYFEPLPAA